VSVHFEIEEASSRGLAELVLGLLGTIPSSKARFSVVLVGDDGTRRRVLGASSSDEAWSKLNRLTSEWNDWGRRRFEEYYFTTGTG
jgi:hypothetical protein